MPQISVCQFSTSRWTFHQDVVKYSLMGADGIGIWRTKVDEVGCQEAADYLFEMKLSASSVHWAGGFTGSNGTSYIDAVNDAIDAVKLAGMLGADTLVVHPGARNGHTHSHAARLLETALNSIIPAAIDYGVRLAVEPVYFRRSCPWTFLNGLEQTMQLISQYDPIDVGLVLDLFHVGTQISVVSRLAEIADRIALVQLSDRKSAGYFDDKRCALGSGCLPISNWLRLLANVGYNGFYEIETWGVAQQSEYSDVLKNELAFANKELEQVKTNSSSTSSN